MDYFTRDRLNTTPTFGFVDDPPWPSSGIASRFEFRPELIEAEQRLQDFYRIAPVKAKRFYELGSEKIQDFTAGASKIGRSFAQFGSSALSSGNQFLADYLKDMSAGALLRHRQLQESGFYDPTNSEILQGAKALGGYAQKAATGIGQRFSGPKRDYFEPISDFTPLKKKRLGDWGGILGGIGFDLIGEAIYAPMQYSARIQEGQTESQAGAGTFASSAGSIAGSALGGLAGRGIARKLFKGKGATALEFGGAIGASMLGEAAARMTVDSLTGADKVAMQKQLEMMQQVSGQGGNGIAQPYNPYVNLAGFY